MRRKSVPVNPPLLRTILLLRKHPLQLIHSRPKRIMVNGYRIPVKVPILPHHPPRPLWQLTPTSIINHPQEQPAPQPLLLLPVLPPPHQPQPMEAITITMRTLPHHALLKTAFNMLIWTTAHLCKTPKIGYSLLGLPDPCPLLPLPMLQ